MIWKKIKSENVARKFPSIRVGRISDYVDGVSFHAVVVFALGFDILFNVLLNIPWVESNRRKIFSYYVCAIEKPAQEKICTH